MNTVDSPFLKGVFAPFRREENIDRLEVVGKIPADLEGVLLRKSFKIPHCIPFGFHGSWVP